MSEINNIIVNIVTFATAVGTLLTVREINKQRKASYRPELILESVFFSGHDSHASSCLRNIECKFPTNWVRAISTHETKSIEKEEKPPNRFTIPLYNIGLGAAREITGSWSFPIVEVVKEINRLAKEEIFIFEKEMLKITRPATIIWIIWSTEKEINFDYILPVTIQKEPVMVIIPNTYIILVSAFVHFLFLGLSENEKLTLPEIIPPLEICLEYFDIGEVKYKTKIKVFLDLKAFGKDFFNACLQPKKVTSMVG